MTEKKVIEFIELARGQMRFDGDGVVAEDKSRIYLPWAVAVDRRDAGELVAAMGITWRRRRVKYRFGISPAVSSVESIRRGEIILVKDLEPGDGLLDLWRTEING